MKKFINWIHFWGIEFWYYAWQRPVGKFRPWLAKYYPEWMVTDALIHAGVRKTRQFEEVHDPSFMDIYERWCKEGRRNV